MYMNGQEYKFTEYYENGDSCEYTMSTDRELSRQTLRDIAKAIGKSHIAGIKREKQTLSISVDNAGGAHILMLQKNQIISD